MPNNKLFLPIILTLMLALGFGGGVFFQKSRSTPALVAQISNTEVGKPNDVDFRMFWNVWSLLQTNYVDKGKLDSQKMLYGAIDGLVKSVGDPYTSFFPPKESEQFAQQIKGAFGGVGIELGQRDGVLTVIAPIKDSPAERAGILAGDKIYKIDGKSTEGMDVSGAVDIIRGEQGTAVTLTIVRESLKEPKDFKLLRDTIKIPAVAWKMLDNNIAYVQVFVFNQNVDSEFKKAATEIAGSSAKRIILDLRNNPGGLLDSAVDLSGFFLDKDKVVTIQREGTGKETIYRTQRNAIIKDYPLVVIVNKGSASASEILAGALRDNRGATIVGETSFGKGSVQDIFPLDKGSSIKITFAKWFTPNGTSINENGIKPDVEVKRTEEDFNNKKDPQLDKAIELIKGL